METSEGQWTLFSTEGTCGALQGSPPVSPDRNVWTRRRRSCRLTWPRPGRGRDSTSLAQTFVTTREDSVSPQSSVFTTVDENRLSFVGCRYRPPTYTGGRNSSETDSLHESGPSDTEGPVSADSWTDSPFRCQLETLGVKVEYLTLLGWTD